MKYLFIALLLLFGISEIIAISTLHDRVGLSNSIYLYLATTTLGGILLWRGWKPACRNVKEGNEISSTKLRNLKKDLPKLSEEDGKKVMLMFDGMLFFIAVIFISIPGVVTDFVGILLSFRHPRTGLIYLLSYT